MQEKKLFVRTASGLVRNITIVDALIIAVACIYPIPNFVNFIPATWPGADINLAMTLVLPFLAIHAFLYSQMGASMPRSGGDYVFVSRTVHPALGFIMSWTFILSSAVVTGSLAIWISNYAASGFFTTLALVYKIPYMMDWAVFAASPTGCWIGGALVLLTAAVITVAGLKWVLRAFRIGVIIGVPMILISMAILFTTSREVFVTAWNTYLSQFVAYGDAVAKAQSFGFSFPPHYPDMTQTTAAGIWAVWIFFGYFITAYMAGEIKDTKRSLPFSMLGGLLLLYVMYVPWIWASIRAYGYDFAASVSYLYFFQSSVLPVWPSVPLLTSLLFPNPVVIGLTWIGLMAWVLILVVSYYMYVSRPMFAWAFDRILPEKLAYVDERWHSPIVSVIVTTLLALLGLTLSTYTTMLVQMNFSLTAVLMIAIASASAIVFPYKKKDVFEASPTIVKYKIAGKIPLISVTGTITTVFMLFMAYITVTIPTIGGYVSPITITILIGTMISGLVIYYLAKWYRAKKEALDISLAFKEVPPV